MLNIDFSWFPNIGIRQMKILQYIKKIHLTDQQNVRKMLNHSLEMHWYESFIPG